MVMNQQGTMLYGIIDTRNIRAINQGHLGSVCLFGLASPHAGCQGSPIIIDRSNLAFSSVAFYSELYVSLSCGPPQESNEVLTDYLCTSTATIEPNSDHVHR